MKGLIELKERYLNLIAGDDFDYDKFNAFAILHHSNAIEGSTLTKEETYFLLSERLTLKNKPVAYSLMAIDHLDALKCVLKLASSKTPLGSVILRAISARLMKNTGSEISSMGGSFDSSKGDFQMLNVRAGTHTFSNYRKVPEQVEMLVGAYQRKYRAKKRLQKRE